MAPKPGKWTLGVTRRNVCQIRQKKNGKIEFTDVRLGRKLGGLIRSHNQEYRV